MLPLAFKKTVRRRDIAELTPAERAAVLGAGGDGGSYTLDPCFCMGPDGSFSTDDWEAIQYD